MIVARGTAPTGRELLVLGLSEGNVVRLRQGEPIFVTAETHPGALNDVDILIMHGATEDAIAAQIIDYQTADGGAMPDVVDWRTKAKD